MNIKLYGIVTAVIVTGVIGLMYIMPSAEASTEHGYSVFRDERGYDNESKIYDEYGKDFTTEDWIKHLRGTGYGDNGFRVPICFLISPSENPNDDCYWTDQIVYGKRHFCNGLYTWSYYNFSAYAIDMIEWYCDKYAWAATKYSSVVEDIYNSKMILENTITRLEADVNEKNDRITGLESKMGELVLLEKNASTLQEKIDKKNTQLENKNKRINNLQGQIKDNKSGIRDIIDTLKADPNTSTDDILEALKKLLQ